MLKIFLLVVLHSILVFANVKNLKGRTLYGKSSSAVTKMVVMGDWGGLPFYPYYSPFEIATAHQIMNETNQQKSDFLLALGDNFYYDGVKDVNDPRFKTTFENIFNDETFKQVPWFVLAGNHDHYGNVSAQLAYSKMSYRWNFPHLWYGIEWQQSDLNITIVMIDTVTLCGNTLADEKGGQPSGKFDESAATEQLQFIENKLKNNKNHYVLVAGHFPVWSVAEHGPTQCLLEKLKPMLEKYQVTAYLSGHDHNLQHIREANSTVEYFVSGAVDVVDPSMKHENSVPAGSLKFHWANILGLGGFATVQATVDSMVLQFHSATGSTLYKYAMKPRK